MAKSQNVYDKIIEKVFFDHYKKGKLFLGFNREEIRDAAISLGLEVPKNLGDVVYTYRNREPLPKPVTDTAPKGMEWIIVGIAKGKYSFSVTKGLDATPNLQLAETKILDATPGIINRYALSDEQALLAKIRYNRLIDIFTGLTCYSLQNHLRTSLKNKVQIELDELYVGVDKRGAHYILPVQAKGGGEKLGSVQICQDITLCSEKYPGATCKSVGAQFLDDNLIALFEFQIDDSEVKIANERHYKLVKQNELTTKELAMYGKRTE